MLTEIAVQYPVFRHGSDNVARDCGRACAQMVIASLVLGGQNAAADRPVPETQQSVRNRETFEAANAGATGPGGWDTFPDELVEVLTNSPDLMGMIQNRWRVAHHTPAADASPGNDRALQNLLADIVVGLKLGKPAILNCKSVDHWVVVSRAWVNDDGSVDSIQFVDPAGLDTGITGAGHTYTEACHNEGMDYWSIWTPIELAAFELTVGTVPPPTYSGEYVAIVPSPVRRPAGFLKSPLAFFSLIQKVVTFFERHPPAQPPVPGPVDDIQTALRQVARHLGLSELHDLLDAHPDVRTLVVKDIEGSDERYLLGSLFDPHSGRGLIGVFNVATNRAARFRLTRRSDLHQSLSGVPADGTLWWTRRRLTTWSLPYYPFQKIGPGKYERLGDGASLVYR